MNIDEFMMHGLDSDVATDDEQNVVGAEDEQNVVGAVPPEFENGNDAANKSKTQAHKDQLARLQEKDPEFYKFLQENDEALLEFDDSETDDDLQVDSDIDEGVGVERTEDDKEKTNEDASEEEQDEMVTKKTGKPVTLAMIKSWTKGLKKNSVASLKQTVRALDCAMQDTLASSENLKEQRSSKYRVEGSEGEMSTSCNTSRSV